MLQNVIYLNGRTTGVMGIRTLVRNKTACAGAATNFWSSTENSQMNAWNANFGSGNMGNNNKYNTYYCRPLAALDENDIIDWIDAFEDCCRHKKSSNQCTLYRLKAVDLVTLAAEVRDFGYKPTTSVTFVVTFPKLREIFAANFRDRIVQHWIVLRIEPLLERRFIEDGDVSYNCRKGYGTLAATVKLRSLIEDVSRGYKLRAYIGKYDIHSFFMSIDVRVLWLQLEPFIREHYHGSDIETLLYLLQETVFHRSQDNCVRKGDTSLWQHLDPRKSLFHSQECIGMPIGNITSQLLANFYLSEFDARMMSLCAEAGAKYVRFVDDFTIVAQDKLIIKRLAHMAGTYLRERLHLQLHPDKVYLQEARHGVKFVGTVIKPGRNYLSNRTIGKFVSALDALEKHCADIVIKGNSKERLLRLDSMISGINSYLGFACHNSSYSILYRNFTKLSNFWKLCHVTAHFHTVKINRKYQLSNYIYGTYLQSRAATPQGGRPHRKSGNTYHPYQLRRKGGTRQRAGQVLLPPGGDVSFSDAPLGHHLSSHQSQV